MSNQIKRTSDSPFIKSVWQLYFDTEGEVTVTADGTWDIVFGKLGGIWACTITGPTNHTVTYPYSNGQEALGITLWEGTYMPGMPARQVINAGRALTTERGVVLIQGIEFDIPTFETAEAFVDQLYERGLLARDPVVEKTLDDDNAFMSARSVQRHFVQTTGLPLSRHQQIARAQKAAALIRGGMALKDVAQECGYFDQAHMNRSLKQILGVTPQQIKDGHEA